MNYRKMMALLLLALIGVCAGSSTKASNAAKTAQESVAISNTGVAKFEGDACGVGVPPALKIQRTGGTPIPQNNQNHPAILQRHNAIPDFWTNQNDVSVDRHSIANVKVSQIESPRKSAPVSCSLEEYRSFFEDFVRGYDYQNEEIRNTYTWSDIQIRDYQNPSKFLKVIGKQNYDDFRIGLIDYSYIYVDSSTKKLSLREQLNNKLKINVKKIDRRTFRVDYVKAEFGIDMEAEDNNGDPIRTYGEPGAYIFEHRNGCWNLTQDLRSPVRSGTAPK